MNEHPTDESTEEADSTNSAKLDVDARQLDLLREFAHEIRTPLTAMLGYTAFLKGEGEVELSAGQIQDFAGRLHTSTRRLLQITERVLDDAISGERQVRKEQVDFTALSGEILQTFEAEAEARGIALSQEIAENFPVLQTDPVVLYEILTNLISNALKFTPKGGAVSIKGEIDVHSNGLILVIQDTGSGIPASILMHMMQGAAVSTTSARAEQKGWGHGIQIVRRKAGLLGGNLLIENADQGGTVACIRLPQAA